MSGARMDAEAIKERGMQWITCTEKGTNNRVRFNADHIIAYVRREGLKDTALYLTPVNALMNPILVSETPEQIDAMRSTNR
jgi:hypothetical protein